MKKAFLILAALLLCAALTPAAVAKRVGAYEMKVLVRGAPIHGANGLAIDQSGRLIIASGLGGELVVLDARTGHIVQRLGHGAGIDQLGPDDVAVGPDGSIYWTDFPGGLVGRVAPDGTVTKQLIAPGMNPIAFSSDGRLFAGQAFAGDGLWELDPDLQTPPRVVIAPSGPPPFFAQLNGFDFGPDGMLYAPQPFLQRIVRIDPETGATTTVADVSAAGHPGSVEFDSHGHLFASMADTNLVLSIDLATGAYDVFVALHATSLDNMVFDAADRLFVSDAYDGRIYRITSGGGVRTLSKGGLMLPGGAALMDDEQGDETLFVTDMWRVVQFDTTSGRQVGVDVTSHVGTVILQSWAVAPDDGNIIVSSFMQNAVQIWDPRTHSQVALYTDFVLPMNALRFDGDLVVAELGTGSVVQKDSGTGVKSVIATGLVYPLGLAASADDLYVGDWVTGTVWQIVADGATLTPARLVAGGLSHPEGLAIDRDGTLLVVESGPGRLSRIDPATGRVTTVASGLAIGMTATAPPSWALSSVVVGHGGRLYVTGDLADVVYRFSPLPGR